MIDTTEATRDRGGVRDAKGVFEGECGREGRAFDGATEGEVLVGQGLAGGETGDKPVGEAGVRSFEVEDLHSLSGH